ncbi:MAG: hypothetical protein C0434_08335 [Xanthomonadaceae bacterium]|nr:hypothetical protein [Xanthomonadaceae bacterium]
MLLQLVDVLIGLTVVYLVFATAASTAVDFAEIWLRRRGRLLERGIAEIFAKTLGTAREGDAAATSTLVEAFYSSPYISSLYEGDYQPGGALLPSAIPPTRFAGAVLALASENPQFKASIERMLKVAGLSLDSPRAKVEQVIATYFNESMERVTGWYRRHVQKILFTLGLLFAVALNADTLQLLKVLSQSPEVREKVVLTAVDLARKQPAEIPACAAGGRETAECEQALADRLGEQLSLVGSLGLPLGWEGPNGRVCGDCRQGEGLQAWIIPVLGKLAGFLLTALATTLGAPFWFDLLTKLLAFRRVVRREPPATAGGSPPPAAPLPPRQG